MRRADFFYELPDALIAQYPAEERRSSRMLCLDGDSGRIVDRYFIDFVEQLQPGDLVVFNNTRVIPARLFGQKSTGGKVEILVERIDTRDTVLAHVRASKSPRPGSRIMVGDAELVVLGRAGALFCLRFPEPGVMHLLENAGHIPLPGYIDRADTAFDSERYQTVYGERSGAVAAPTAGLHFDGDTLAGIAARGVHTAFVTLHVGAGTFQPVRVDDLRDHRMHAEWLEVTEDVCKRVAAVKQAGKRVIAVGTTSVRSLEAAAVSGVLQPFRGDTQLFITPGYTFRVVDCLLTNFHLPESTLIMLVSAFAGHEHVMRAYRHAVEQRYRFFSYGDAMWLTGTGSAAP